MNDHQAGRLLRAFRRRRGWRQVDLAARAGMSQTTESDAELGRLDTMTLGAIRRLFATCDALVDLNVRGRPGDDERLLDEVHADLVRAIGEYLAARGWTCWFEVTYSQYGERGSIDVLAVRGDAVLVVEVKSDLSSLEATLRKLDEKTRLAAQIVFERTGKRPSVVGRLLVLPEASTPRRRVAAHAVVFDGALPARGRTVREWLDRPASAMAGLLFLSPGATGGAGRRAVSGRSRIRCRRGVHGSDAPAPTVSSGR